jgi:hypothetical protein
MIDCRSIFNFKQQKMDCFEAISISGKTFLAFLVEEINALKMHSKTIKSEQEEEEG